MGGDLNLIYLLKYPRIVTKKMLLTFYIFIETLVKNYANLL